MTKLQQKKIIYTAACLASLTGCAVPTANPVIFGQETSVGISIGQSAATQIPEFKVGYNDANVAYLPTVAVDGDGNLTALGGVIDGNGGSYKETYSVLGQFDVEATNGTNGPGAKLGKFFATGNAAVKLSAGFACGVSEGKDQTHCHK